jgi:septum site-determining protein MinD
VPDEERVVIATNHGEPVVGTESLSSAAFLNICRRITGEAVPLTDFSSGESFLQKMAAWFRRK